ncbi:MAG: hypothetical protein ACP5KN_12865 [Armatimonadota bacterium]
MNRSTVAMLVAVAGLVGYTALAAPAAVAQPQNEVKILAGEDEKPTTSARETPEVFDIGIDGETFFRIRASAAGFTAAERTRIVYARLIHIISYGEIDPGAVRITRVRGKPTIYAGNVRLVTVYPSDVEATNAESMVQLAKIWAASTACCLEQFAPWSRVAKEE